MIFFLRYLFERILKDLRGNAFLNLTTIGIIAISMLIFSAFSLIAFNLTCFLKMWEEKIEVIVYLKKETPLGEMEPLLKKIRLFEGIDGIKYVSPTDAMDFMERRLGNQKNLLDGIQSTILPASLEIQLKKNYRNSAKIREVASWLKQFPQVEEIQYGQEWVETFSVLVNLVRLTQWILGGLILAALIIIISNTIQLTLSSRREEIDMMHMVGARPAFIQIPIYLEGLIQGLLGAGLAILLLFLLYKIFFLYIIPSMKEWVAGIAEIPLLFLPLKTLIWILFVGMVLGFFGSFVASMRFLKYRE